MGWASGARIAEGLWCSLRDYVPQERRKEIARGVWQYFADEDCDTLDEADQLASDCAWPDARPEGDAT